MLKRSALAVVFVTAAGGCSGAGSSTIDLDGGVFVAAPLDALTSESGVFRVEARTSPQPPVRGIIAAELAITRVADGSPVDGLTLGIQPWMPAMNHGASTPTVTPEGGGKYLVTSLDVFMAGHWELRTTFSQRDGGASDHVAPAFDVP